MSKFKILSSLFLFLMLSSGFSISFCKVNLIEAEKDGLKFDFPIGAKVFNNVHSLLYIGAKEAIDNNEYALSCIGLPGASVPASNNLLFKDKLVPLAPGKVKLDNILDQDNPIYGSKIKLLSLFGNNLAVVKDSEPGIIYLVDISEGPFALKVFSFDKFKDQEIVSLGTNYEGNQSAMQYNFLLAGVASKKEEAVQNEFDIFVFRRGSVKEKVKNGENEEEKTVASGLIELGKEVSISKDSSVISINGSLSFIDKALSTEYMIFKSPIDPNKAIGVLYLGFKVKPGQDKKNGARALALGSFDNQNQLVLASVAPDTAFDEQGQIIGGTGNKVFNINKVKSLTTSTHLPYLIVVKDDSKVFALPLVNDLDLKSGYGQLANVNSKPVDKFSKGGRFIARVFDSPAILPQDLYTEESVPAKVGGNAKLLGEITDIQVSNDIVYVSVNSKDKQNFGGLFYSRALFDSDGKIKLWTDWKRTSGITQGIDSFAVDITNSATWSINSSNPKNLYRTFWSDGSSNIEKTISKLLPQSESGVLSVLNLPYKRSNKMESLTLATGLNKVAILELSSNNSALKSDNVFDLMFWNYINIGSIVSAEIITSNNYNYLVVGGSKGLAILSDSNGLGWPVDLEPTKEFLSHMKFNKVNDLKNIIKLSSVDNNLYILTLKELKSFIFNKDKVVSKNLITTSQAHSNINYFTDLIATPNALFIGSTSGLITYDFSSFKTISLPEGIGSELGVATPVSKLYAYTPTGCDKDLIYNGNLYVINGYKAWQRSQVYRFEVNGSNLKPIKDLYIKDKPTMFADLGNYYNSLLFDGAQMWAAKSKFNRMQFKNHTGSMYEKKIVSPFIYIFRPEVKSSQRGVYLKSQSPANLNIKDHSSISNMVRTYASGVSIVSGDFGVRFNG